MENEQHPQKVIKFAGLTLDQVELFIKFAKRGHPVFARILLMDLKLYLKEGKPVPKPLADYFYGCIDRTLNADMYNGENFNDMDKHFGLRWPNKRKSFRKVGEQLQRRKIAVNTRLLFLITRDRSTKDLDDACHTVANKYGQADESVKNTYYHYRSDIERMSPEELSAELNGEPSAVWLPDFRKENS